MKVKLRELATKKKLSLYALAGELDLNKQMVYNWANGNTHIKYEYLELLGSFFNCPISDILELEGHHQLVLDLKE